MTDTISEGKYEVLNNSYRNPTDPNYFFKQ